MSMMHLNHLCVLDGDYKILKKDFDIENTKSSKQTPHCVSNGLDKLNELIEFYKINLQQQGQDECFQLIHSKDGSELYSNLLNSFGLLSMAIPSSNSTMLCSFSSSSLNLTADLDKTINNLNEYLSFNSKQSLSALTGSNATRLTTSNHFNNNNNSNYICFIICDFDQTDQIFIKLEETQQKLTSLLSALALNNSSIQSQLSTSSASNLSILQAALPSQQKRFLIFGWPVLYYCIKNDLCLTMATDVERPLYCKLMSGCFVCFTGFRKENKQTVANCIKLVHYMGGSVRKEYNKRITHLIVKSTLSTKYKTAYNIGKCHLLTEDWIVDAWKHRNEVDFDVNDEDFLKKFKLKALYSLSIAFYGFTPEETEHMKEVTLENGGQPITDLNDPMCTHIVINDQEVKQLPSEDGTNPANNGNTSNPGSITPTSCKTNNPIFIDLNQSPFSNTRASIVRAEWFWASIQICCRASECLYEFTKSRSDSSKPNVHDPPNKRIKLSVDNLLSTEALNSTASATLNTSHSDSPHFGSNANQRHGSPSNHHYHHYPKISSSNNLLRENNFNEYDSPQVCNHAGSSTTGLTRLSTDRLLNGTANRQNMSNNNLSTSASLLDATTDDAMSIDSPFDKNRDSSHGLLSSASSNGTQGVSKKMSKRSQRIFELFETEKRFVNILHTIIFYFKEPIEAPDQVAGPILDQTECKEIFGNLPPIYEVHCKIKDKLERIVNRMNLNEEVISVGEIYLDNSDALLKTYPPFVNFYEKTKDAIQSCDKTKPRFHAFLKIAQSKPECGRQTLSELLIRPVQRLPSTLLLLDDILKETPKTHRDHELLSKAISSLKEVMTHINEDKRKIENQLNMFVLMNDIENCPANLLSSHRSFLKKLYVTEMSNELAKKGAQLVLFLFSDCLEICKPRFKLHNGKSPSTNSQSRQRSPTKLYKHVSLFSLNNVTKVCDILQNGDDTDLFGILCRLAGEKDKFYSFKVIPNTSNQSSSNTSCNNPNLQINTSSLYSTISSQSSNSSNNSSSLYCSTTNLNFYDENGLAQMEKKEFIKLLAQGICNVKCITEYNYFSISTPNLNLLTLNSPRPRIKAYSSIFDEVNSNLLQIERLMDEDMDSLQQEHLNYLVKQRLNNLDPSQKPVQTFRRLVKNQRKFRVYNSYRKAKHGKYKRNPVKSRYRRNYAIKSKQTNNFTNQTNLIIDLLNKKENILCTIEAKQLQIDLNESGSKKLEAVKSYARIINRRVSRAFSFSQDTPNKIKKTISSVFRSPFQSSYSQQSLNQQKSSKLASLASLQLTPTLVETKRKFITLQKSRDVLTHTQLFRQQTCSNIITQTTSSLLSLDTCLSSENELDSMSSKKSTISESEIQETTSISSGSGKQRKNSSVAFPDITNIFQTGSFKRQLT